MNFKQDKPKELRIGQFIYDFLVFVNYEYSGLGGMADPFYLPDDTLEAYYRAYKKSLKK
jgi:hypothetical protein